MCVARPPAALTFTDQTDPRATRASANSCRWLVVGGQLLVQGWVMQQEVVLEVDDDRRGVRIQIRPGNRFARYLRLERFVGQQRDAE